MPARTGSHRPNADAGYTTTGIPIGATQRISLLPLRGSSFRSVRLAADVKLLNLKTSIISASKNQH
jgi:hypothetical protein